jgi:hypothetical protein
VPLLLLLLVGVGVQQGVWGQRIWVVAPPLAACCAGVQQQLLARCE